MNFYTERDYHTSDNADYYRNRWDKGHLAPAATFSDSYNNLRQTFSFLNCALQDQDLNRGQWRLLEEQERRWDDNEELLIEVELLFSDSILPTKATLPSKFIKHIKFSKSNVYRCYSFPNEKPIKTWEEYEVKHSH
jgi:endonuclease G